MFVPICFLCDSNTECRMSGIGTDELLQVTNIHQMQSSQLYSIWEQKQYNLMCYPVPDSNKFLYLYGNIHTQMIIPICNPFNSMNVQQEF